MNNQNNGYGNQGSYQQQHQQQNQQQNQNQGQQQNQAKQPLSRGLVQIPVGSYQSKTKTNPDNSPVMETEFLPLGKFVEWEKHINVDIYVQGEHLKLMLFKNDPSNRS